VPLSTAGTRLYPFVIRYFCTCVGKRFKEGKCLGRNSTTRIFLYNKTRWRAVLPALPRN
jgi:hypothetical protein